MACRSLSPSRLRASLDRACTTPLQPPDRRGLAQTRVPRSLLQDWKPVLTIQSIVMGLQFLMLEPNPDDPLNKEVRPRGQDDARPWRPGASATNEIALPAARRCPCVRTQAAKILAEDRTRFTTMVRDTFRGRSLQVGATALCELLASGWRGRGGFASASERGGAQEGRGGCGREGGRGTARIPELNARALDWQVGPKRYDFPRFE